jgi:hypothetical protein
MIREIVQAALKQNGLALQFISKSSLIDDREIVLVAVKQDGLALQYVSDDMKGLDYDVVWAAVNENGEALRYLFLNKKCAPIYVDSSGHTQFEKIDIKWNLFAEDVLFPERKQKRSLWSNFEQDREIVIAALAASRMGSSSFACSFARAGYKGENLKRFLKHRVAVSLSFKVFLMGWLNRSLSPSPGGDDQGTADGVEVGNRNHISPPSSSNSTLWLLMNKLGKYVSLDVKKRIASCLGPVFIGEKLERYRRALRLLKIAPKYQPPPKHDQSFAEYREQWHTNSSRETVETGRIVEKIPSKRRP